MRRQPQSLRTRCSCPALSGRRARTLSLLSFLPYLGAEVTGGAAQATRAGAGIGGHFPPPPLTAGVQSTESFPCSAAYSVPFTRVRAHANRHGEEGRQKGMVLQRPLRLDERKEEGGRGSGAAGGSRGWRARARGFAGGPHEIDRARADRCGLGRVFEKGGGRQEEVCAWGGAGGELRKNKRDSGRRVLVLPSPCAVSPLAARPSLRFASSPSSFLPLGVP